MSFPLDSIRQGDSDEGGEVRREIAYPGVHSDVGGGYGPGAQGKGCDSKGKGMDARKLSQIALHDMYIAALSYGVPLMKAGALSKNEDLARDFALHADTIAAFNAWLDTTSPISRLEDAMRFGMEQMLSWRALRAQVASGTYITHQKFFEWAREDALTPYKVKKALEEAEPDDPQLRELTARKHRAQARKTQAQASKSYPDNLPLVDAAQQEIDKAVLAIRTRTEELCAELAYPGAAPGERPAAARPGEGAGDMSTNDKTDLLQGAEEMRLLLAHLHPDQRQNLRVGERIMQVPTNNYPQNANPPKTLSVTHEQKGSDSPSMSLVDVGLIKFHAARTSLGRLFNVADDVLPKPVEDILPFLREHTSQQVFGKLPEAVKVLFDHYVHDSRCWFRVPYFHEYAPGGYGWPRIVFAGMTRLPWLASDSLSVALHMFDSPETAVA